MIRRYFVVNIQQLITPLRYNIFLTKFGACFSNLIEIKYDFLDSVRFDSFTVLQCLGVYFFRSQYRLN